jgi:hypothetical protein
MRQGELAALRDVARHAKAISTQIICLGGKEPCQPCRDRERLCKALYRLARITNSRRRP